MKNKAFTLIEILVVTSIISFFSSIVVNQSRDTRLKSQDSHMKTEAHELSNAIALYKNDNDGKVPIGIDHLLRAGDIVYENDSVDGGEAYRSSMQLLVDEGYIPQIPTSPSGESYSYYVTDDQKNAMFAAELNLLSTGSGGSSKNSCDFVQMESYDATQCTGIAYGDAVPEGWEYFEESSVLCSMHGDPQCYPNSDGLFLVSGYNPSCATYYYDTDFEDFTCGGFLSEQASICPSVGVQCNGSSNLDFCSCI